MDQTEGLQLWTIKCFHEMPQRDVPWTSGSMHITTADSSRLYSCFKNKCSLSCHSPGYENDTCWCCFESSGKCMQRFSGSSPKKGECDTLCSEELWDRPKAFRHLSSPPWMKGLPRQSGIWNMQRFSPSHSRNLVLNDP